MTSQPEYAASVVVPQASPDSGRRPDRAPKSPPIIPPDERVPFREKLAYGSGGMAGGIDSASERMINNPIFVLTLGVSPAVMSACSVVYSLWSGLCEMTVGNLSDKTRSRWGRRKPYMFVGAFLMAAWMPVLFLFDRSWSLPWIIAWMVACNLIALVFNAIWNIPYQCLLLESTPNSTERTNVAVFRAYTGTLTGLGMAWLWWLTQRPIFADAAGNPDVIHGALWVFVGLGAMSLVLGLMPLFTKERVAARAAAGKGEPKAELTLRENLRLTFTSRAFVILIVFTFLMTLANAVKGGLEFFTRFNYVFQGDIKLAAAVSGVGGTVATLVALAGIPIFQYIANRWGKVLTVKLIMGIGLCGSLSTLVLYTPDHPYLSLLPGLMVVPGMAAIWVLIPSMTGDCVDEDQLRTDRRREGSFQATFSWTLRLSTSFATLISGPLVVLVGYDASLKDVLQPEDVVFRMRIILAIVPAALMGLAFWMICKYPLTPPTGSPTRSTTNQTSTTAP